MKTFNLHNTETLAYIYVRQYRQTMVRIIFVLGMFGLFAFGSISVAEAAFPVVQATSNGGNTTVGVSTAITLPSGVSNGNLLMVFFIKDGTAAPTSITGTGWNSLGAGAGSAQYYVAYWKIADGSDTLTVNHASVKTAYAAYRITGHDPNTAPEVDTAQATNANPNPPTHNPVNWNIEDTLWISSFGWDRLGSAASNLSAYPTNFSGSQTSFVSGATANDVGMAVSTRNLQAASDDPGTATLSQSVPWIARTISVRPIPTLTLSGTLFTDAGITPESSVKTIAVAVGTSTPGRFSSTSVSTTGEWSVTLPAGHGVLAGTPIMIWVDDDASFRATVVTKASSTDNITGLNLYKNRVIVRHEGTSATSTTNVDLSFYTNDQDNDLRHSVNNGVLSIEVGDTLYVWPGDTFAPGGDVVIAGNGGQSALQGSFFLADNSVYIAGGTLQIAGSITTRPGSVYTPGTHTTIFNATTSGKTINAPVASLGNVKFDGIGGEWTFLSAATSSNFSILQGSVTAPTTTLGITGAFQNSATFLNNNGSMRLQGNVTSDFISYVAGRDISGNAAGTGNLSIAAMVTVGNMLYVAKSGDATACSQVAGSAIGCELMVFDISSSTNPVYVAGRDSSGSAAGTSTVPINAMVVKNDQLYIGKNGDSTACSQIAGQARGCELMIFSVSSTTNPTYVVGRDESGTAAGTGFSSIQTMFATDSILYIGKISEATACSQVAGSATGCELVVFNISSSTNPTFVAGRDASGDTTGTGAISIVALSVKDNALYVGKLSDGTACSQTAGSAIGCELMVFDISSSTNPVYVAGRDSSGSAAGTTFTSVQELLVLENTLYVGKAGSGSTCSAVAGSAIGCELMVFDISSSTNPVYVTGREAAGGFDGANFQNVNNLITVDRFLYVAKSASGEQCLQIIGGAFGCELNVFDISSTTNPVYVAGQDVTGSVSGVLTTSLNALASNGVRVYVGNAGNATACSQVAGSAVGCEITSYTLPAGVVQGNVAGTNAIGDLETIGLTSFFAVASTSDIRINTGSTFVVPNNLTVQGDFTNNGTALFIESTLEFESNSSQTISGTLVGTSSLPNTFFAGSGTKTFTNNASTSNLTIRAGSVVAPNQLTVAGNYTNNGVFTAGAGTLTISSYFSDYLSARDSSGSETGTTSLNTVALAISGNYLFVGRLGNTTACSQTAGGALGCELLVFDISSTTNPIYVAGRDGDASATGTTTNAINSLTVSGNYLYVGKAGNVVTPCSQTAGSAIGCELIVFDISSPTNPVYVAGRDASGDSSGTGGGDYESLASVGNLLYVGKAGSGAACSQTVGAAAGCELQVYNISSPTNPIFVAGRDESGSAAGTGGVDVRKININGSRLYVGKDQNNTACSQVAGSATGCELMVFDISSTTNPVYVAGRDASGSATGATNGNIGAVTSINNLVIVGKLGDPTACSQVAGSAIGCEIMVFDVSSTTNPVYVAGRDASGSATGVSNVWINAATTVSNLLYVGKNGDTTACSQVAGSADGCELMVFDISSTTNPVYVEGRDATGSKVGIGSTVFSEFIINGTKLYMGGSAGSSPCSLTTITNCELRIAEVSATVSGNLSGPSAFNEVAVRGVTSINNNASTTDLIINSGGYLIAPTTDLSVSGDFTNNGGFAHNNGEVVLVGTNQAISSNATTTFYDFTQIATAAATTTFSTSSPFVILRNLNLQGAATATPLRLRSAGTGTQWRIDPYSTTTATLLRLDVQDSNNISATATLLVCGAGCRDGGNNLNWALGLQYTLSGILYREDGVTPYATATPIRLVIPLASTYFQTATSASTTGAYSMTVSESFLATSTPYFLFADNAVGIDANTVVKSSSTISSISGLDLYKDHLILRTEGGTSTPVTNEDLALYNLTSDNDLRYTVDSGFGLQVLSPNALVVWNNSSFAPEGSVVVSGVASTTATVGTFALRDGAVYTPSSRTTLAGSLRASTTAVYNPGLAVLEFNATTTGKTINSQLPTLGSIRFNGTGGAWSFTQTNATTSDFIIDRGSVTAPSGILASAGVFTNNATFTNNTGIIKVVGNNIDDNDRAATFVTGLDTQARKTGSGAGAYIGFDIEGDYLFVGRSADGSLSCAQSAGPNASRCEIQIFSIASTTNPVYAAGRDGDGSSNGTGGTTNVNDVKVAGNYLYAVKSGTSTPCSQVAGSANGCELMVFDVTDPTNPVYIAGRDADGSSSGIVGENLNTIEIVGNFLYVGKAGLPTACSQSIGSAQGCELMVFDISDPTNPLYVAGRDSNGSPSGTSALGIQDISTQGNNLYVVKFGDPTACNQTIGSANGCEIMIFNIASTTNPTLTRAIDVLGTDAGILGRTIFSVDINDSMMVIGKESGNAACQQSAGSSHGCEIVIFNISSSTNPVFVAGRDASGDASGTSDIPVTSVVLRGNNLYVGKSADTTPCSQVVGAAVGCEFMVFDISSTTNPTYVAGRDNSGSKDGVEGRSIGPMVAGDTTVYVGKNGNTTNCSQSTVGTGAIGCELMVYQSLQPAGILSGNLTATNAISSLETQNRVSFASNASTTNIAVATSSTLTGATNLTLFGNFTNAGTYIGPEGSTFLASSSGTQNFTGTASSSTTFDTLTFGAAGTKNLNLNATATDFTVPSGVTVTYANDLSINRDYTNNGTVTAGATSELILTGENPLDAFVAGRDSNASATGTRVAFYSDTLRVDNTLYVVSDDNTTACSQVAGSAQGCELQVYDISSTTNPIYVAGRDSSGSAAGTSQVNSFKFAVSGQTLYISRFASSTACSQVAGSAQGCELQVYDISSTTNPIYVAGRDASGSATGVISQDMKDIFVHNNYLYAALDASTTVACSQVAGSAQGCELQVYDISSTTNPIYVAGRDATGDSTGTFDGRFETLMATSSWLYIGKGTNSTPCSQVAGSAQGCEIQVYNISTPSNPIYVAGRDAAGDGSATGTEDVEIEVSGNLLFAAKSADATPCSQVAGFAEGCELMIFDISSSSNPVYIAGRDTSGDSTGTSSLSIEFTLRQGNYLYVTKAGTSTACSQVAGLATGCELMVFDISSSTNPEYIAGIDASGSTDGTAAIGTNRLEIIGSNLYVTKDDDATACSQVAGSAVGCELMVFTLGNRLRGNMTGTSAHQSVVVNGPTEWLNNASTSDTIITNSGLMNAPTDYSLTGDFTNNGTYYARGGTVTLLGTDQTLTSNATTTFNNLVQVATTSATTTFSTSGAFVSTGMLRLQGTSTGRLKLRSDVDGSQWTILPQATTSVAWLDVKDSKNASSTVIECSDNCINRGNTVNWIFFSPLGTGTSTLKAHDAGQVGNSFGTATATDEELLAFQIETNSGSTTFSNLVFGLQGISGVSESDLTNFRLVQDRNSNRTYDAGDILVGGIGDVTWSGASAVVGFYEPFEATTTRNYVVVADIAPIANGSFLTIGIGPNGISAIDSTGAQTILGTAVSFQHSRNNRGAGGSSASIGSPAPEGDGDVGGGDTTGGEQIGSDPDFFWPTSNSGSWINAAFAYDGIDGTYATTSSASNHNFTNHGFGIPGANTIGGIEVKLELSGTTAAGSVDVQLSWDGGTSWTSTKSTPTLTTSDVVRTLGSPSDLWGRTWTTADFSNANFAVRLVGSPSSNTIRVDAIQVRVYHVTSGGGGGGGGGAI